VVRECPVRVRVPGHADASSPRGLPDVAPNAPRLNPPQGSPRAGSVAADKALAKRATETPEPGASAAARVLQSGEFSGFASWGGASVPREVGRWFTQAAPEAANPTPKSRRQRRPARIISSRPTLPVQRRRMRVAVGRRQSNPAEAVLLSEGNSGERGDGHVAWRAGVES